MMRTWTPRQRRAFSLFEVLIVLALFLILFALLLPGVAALRQKAAQAQSTNNMKQLGLAVHNYAGTNNFFPPGLDDNNFSTAAYLLPYIEQANVFNLIDFKKSIDDKANAPARKVIIKTFLNPMDTIVSVSADYGATNYLFNAGSDDDLKDNNGLFYLNSKTTFAAITDGTSNTAMSMETLKGDSMVKAVTVKRQHVLLKKEALKGLKPEAGVDDWKNDKNIAADRCASWMDGRFLQGTFTGTRALNDEKPDVNCAGAGGLSAARSLTTSVPVGMGDGSVRRVSNKMSLETWKNVCSRADGNVLGNDF
jgi:prepilin-type N-terminal cleavage/methylation domain-containing protein